MKRIMCANMLSILLVLLAMSASAENVTLQAAVPGDAGTITLTFTLDEANPAVMENYSSVAPGSSAVPEPSTLVLVGLGVLGLALAKKWRHARKD